MLFYDTEDLLLRKFSLCSFQAKLLDMVVVDFLVV